MESNGKIGPGKNIELIRTQLKEEESQRKRLNRLLKQLNQLLKTVAPDLTIWEGRNRHPPIWLADSGEGYEKKGSEEMVYKLQKALYGLKQTPRTWFSRIESYFIKEGFKSSSSEQTLCWDRYQLLALIPVVRIAQQRTHSI